MGSFGQWRCLKTTHLSSGFLGKNCPFWAVEPSQKLPILIVTPPKNRPFEHWAVNPSQKLPICVVAPSQRNTHLGSCAALKLPIWAVESSEKVPIWPLAMNPLEKLPIWVVAPPYNCPFG